ncbi:MAG: leucyl aminopeptidase family protein [Phycisphaeraceae bacterium]|nr:leucyl aminopeptidase family protein [Phycisphaeraceae bacterium]
MVESFIELSESDDFDGCFVMLRAGDDELPSGYRALDESLGGAISAALDRPETSLKHGSVQALYSADGARRIWIGGLGDQGRRPLAALRDAMGRAVRAARGAKVERLAVRLLPALAEVADPAAIGQAAGEAAEMGAYRFNAMKGAVNESEEEPALAVSVEPELREGFDRGLTLGRAANVTRELSATPPNHAGPADIVQACLEMANEVGLDADVIDADRAEELGMGGLLAVGAAGSQPPALVCLEHLGGEEDDPPVMLVGKAVTFDTGGYSIKSSKGMASMKYDKCGGMAVIGAMQAVACLGLKLNVIGLVPTAENMVGQTAYRPDDILRMYNGVTVEVTNTDAEGRLILADALSWGCGHYRPSHVIDLATLTGGVVVALGSDSAGLFATDTDFAATVTEAGEASGERVWSLPLWPEHRRLLKSEHADIVNSGGGRGAHAIQGAAFLSHFVDRDGAFESWDQLTTLPWAHLDIAGVATRDDEGGLCVKGPTGFGVRLVVETLNRLAADRAGN